MVENAESQIGGEIESESDVEMKAIIEDLESKFARMESDLKILLHSDATEAQLKKINEMFEEFKTNTITKDEFVAGIEDKADKEEIANIVSLLKWNFIVIFYPPKFSIPRNFWFPEIYDSPKYLFLRSFWSLF